jgi:hypothetical protein
MSAEDPFPPEEGVPAEDEVKTLDQYSKALNVYSQNDTSAFGRLAINFDDELEVSYKFGLGAVKFPGPLKFVHGGAPYELGQEWYNLVLADQDEKQRAEAAETLLQTNITAEQTRATAAEGVNAAAVVTEKTRAEAAEGTLAAGLAAEVANRISAVTTINANISSEAAARSAADGIHTSGIATNVSAIAAEATTARAAELANANAITAEVGRADTEEKRIVGLVNTEKSRALAAEAAGADNLNSYITNQAILNQLEKERVNDAITAENTRAVDVENSLQNQITALLSNTDAVALNSLAELVTEFSTNGSTITSSLQAEVERATAAETAAIARLDAIEAMLQALQAQ